MDCRTKTQDNSIYALYKGNDYVADGTLEEIAKATGRTVRNLKRYTWKSYYDWAKERDSLLDRNNANRISLILLESDKEIKKNFRYKVSIPEEIYNFIIEYSELKKITRNETILRCIEYALEHKNENFFKEISDKKSK